MGKPIKKSQLILSDAQWLSINHNMNRKAVVFACRSFGSARDLDNSIFSFGAI
jgi:hypothetical protein